MILQEHHKQFAVKCFAQFMTRTQVVNTFIQEFQDELPKPPTQQQNQQNPDDIDNQLDKEKYFDDWARHYYQDYQTTYGGDAEHKYQQDLPKIQQQIEKNYAELQQKQQGRTHTQQNEIRQQQTEEHNKKLRKQISNQLKVYNITHSRFPDKYKDLFKQTRQQFIENERDPDSNHDDIINELENIYGYIKQQIFQANSPNEVAANARLAHTILKTIGQRRERQPPSTENK